MASLREYFFVADAIFSYCHKIISKTLAAAIAAVMTISIVGCGSTKTSESSPSTTAVAPSHRQQLRKVQRFHLHSKRIPVYHQKNLGIG